MVSDNKPERFAFIVNAVSGRELRGTDRDVSRVYYILTHPELGTCRNDFPPAHGIGSRNEFYEKFFPIIKKWHSENQLIFYFSGHGEIRDNDKYCLCFGDDFLPFSNLINDLKAYGVYRAIIVIDACQSEKAIEGVKSTNQHEDLSNAIEEANIPKGLAIIASSKKYQLSQELEDGSHGVFTKIFCEGIDNGLGGQPTVDGLVNVEDIVNYITEKLNNDDSYSLFTQRPVFSINKANRSIWIAKNKSGSTKNKLITSKTLDSSLRNNVNSLDELRFLYESTNEERHPCIMANIHNLDWNLVNKYAEENQKYGQHNSQEELLSELGLYSPIRFKG